MDSFHVVRVNTTTHRISEILGMIDCLMGHNATFQQCSHEPYDNRCASLISDLLMEGTTVSAARLGAEMAFHFSCATVFHTHTCQSPL